MTGRMRLMSGRMRHHLPSGLMRRRMAATVQSGSWRQELEDRCRTNSA